MPDPNPETFQADLRNWLTRTASSADDVADIAIRRIRKRWGRGGVPQIQPYTGFATADTIHLRGRVLNNPPLDPDFRNDRWWQNLSHTWRRFASDEVPGVTIEGSFAGVTGHAVSDSEGCLELDIPCATDNEQVALWMPAQLAIVDDGRISSLESFTVCDVMRVSSKANYAVVSDVDDTILRTGATEISTMATAQGHPSIHSFMFRLRPGTSTICSRIFSNSMRSQKGLYSCQSGTVHIPSMAEFAHAVAASFFR